MMYYCAEDLKKRGWVRTRAAGKVLWWHTKYAPDGGVTLAQANRVQRIVTKAHKGLGEYAALAQNIARALALRRAQEEA